MKYHVYMTTQTGSDPEPDDDNDSGNGGSYEESHSSGGDYGNQK